MIESVFYWLGVSAAALAGWSALLAGTLFIADRTIRWLEGHRAILAYVFYRKRFHAWIKAHHPREAAEFGMRLDPMPSDVRDALEYALEVIDDDGGVRFKDQLASQIRGALERYPA